MLFFERETLQRRSLAYNRPNNHSHKKILGKFFKRAWTRVRQACALEIRTGRSQHCAHVMVPFSSAARLLALCSVSPGRAQHEPQGYAIAGLTSYSNQSPPRAPRAATRAQRSRCLKRHLWCSRARSVREHLVR